MRIGKEKHERILTETIQQLENEDYKLIRLDGKGPTAIAVKDNVSYAVCILGRHGDKNGKMGRTKTIINLEDWYHMFDKIDRIHFDNTKDNRKNVIDKVFKEYTKRGYKIIFLAGKSPDAIAYKNNNIFAIEVVGIKEGYTSRHVVQGKEYIYNMFDGLLIKTFCYDSNNVFTETYGNGSIHCEGVGV